MEDPKITIKASSGRYTLLDKMYNNFIKKSLINIDEETEVRWYTYEAIMKELIDMGKLNYFQEIKYRITGGGNPNDIILDVIQRDNEVRTYMWPHIGRIKYYKNEDLINRFY